MMRQGFVVLVLLGWPALVAAQPVRSPSPALSTLAPIGLPLPQIGLPLPSIGLPLPSRVLQPSDDGQWRGTSTAPPLITLADDRKSGAKRRLHSVHTIVYFGSFYPWQYEPHATPGVVTPGAVVPDAAPVSAPPATGRLRLEVHPEDDLQLFVDGLYVGTRDDFGGELELEQGSRRIEIRAPGYETLVFNARIVAQRTITYRGALKPIAPESPHDSPPGREADAPAARAETAGPPRRQTFYFIPGCYMGNIPPHEVQLPSGCDLSRVTTWTP
jgi:hypothetical protein